MVTGLVLHYLCDERVVPQGAPLTGWKEFMEPLLMCFSSSVQLVGCVFLTSELKFPTKRARICLCPCARACEVAYGAIPNPNIPTTASSVM